MFVNEIKPKLSFKYYCDFCDYGTSKKSNIDNHNLSAKHQKSMFSNENSAKLSPDRFTCKTCKKVYKDNSGLWRHSKKCVKKEPSDVIIEVLHHNNETTQLEIITELFQEQMKENKELKELLIEQNKKLIEMSENQIKNITNNTTNNFNLNFFLMNNVKMHLI